MEKNYTYSTPLSIQEKIRLFNGSGSWQTYNAEGKVNSFFMSDGPHGLRKQDIENYADINNSKTATCFPTASCIASSWDRKSLRRMAKAIATEAIAENVNIVLGPGINIKRSPLCGRNFEYFSEDPYLAGTLASEYINSMQEEGVGTSLKHFAANNQETRRQTVNSIIDDRTLNEIYLRPFEIAVKNAHPVTIMSSYNRVNGEWVSRNKNLLTDILRKKWGFQGAVISDWGACLDAPKCLKAGMDLSMPDSYGYFDSQIQNALVEQQLSEEELDTANHRILSLADSFAKNLKDFPPKVDYSKQHQIALELATESAVLLKNDDVLPLKPKTELLIIGELAELMKFQGGGSSHITTANYPNAIEALKSKGFICNYEKGYNSSFMTKKSADKLNKTYLETAINKTKQAVEKNIPVLVFAGLTEAYEGEGFDRTDLSIPQEQIKLIDELTKITQNIILVTFSGSPIDLSFSPKVSAILHMYLCGEACGQACAELLSGVVSPSGKLAETFPSSLSDIPSKENFALSEDNIFYKERLNVGYRHYESHNIPVQYEFGYGLSYTKFDYSDFKIEVLPTDCINTHTCKISFTVKNTGNYDGAEISQVYVINPQDDLNRPKIELRGFTKTFIEKNHSQKIEIILDKNCFKVFSTKQDKFVTVPGEYIIAIGKSVKNHVYTEKILVEGVKPSAEDLFIDDSKLLDDRKVEIHKKGTFTTTDSLGDMAKESKFVSFLLKIIDFAYIKISKAESKDDPSVKIALSALRENPVESLISTSNGIIKPKLINMLIKKANK